MFEPINTYTCSASENDCLNFSFLKDIHVVDKKVARKGRKRPFISRKFWATVSTTFYKIHHNDITLVTSQEAVDK